MQFIHADCEVRYSGRGDTVLPRHERVICIKSDNTVLVMSDKGLKPLNYMPGSTKPKVNRVENPVTGTTTIYAESRNEYIIITCHRIFSSWNPEVSPDDPGLTYDGTEEQIQEWLFDNIQDILPFRAIQREYKTENGKVDILVHQEDNPHDVFLVEVKRTAMSDAVHQLKRYYEGCEIEKGFLIALDVRPSAIKRAEKYGIPWVQLTKQDNGYAVEKTSYE